MSRNNTPSILSTLTAYDSTDEEEGDEEEPNSREKDVSAALLTEKGQGQVTLFPTVTVSETSAPSTNSSTQKEKLISSLTHNYEDEENFEYNPQETVDEDEETTDTTEQSNKDMPLAPGELNVENSGEIGDMEKKTEENNNNRIREEGPSSEGELPRKKRKVMIPPEPEGTCSPELQQRFKNLLAMKLRGKNPNKIYQQMKDFRNPSIYEKFIDHLDIDENGTNFPDQPKWNPSSYYDELDKAQIVEMQRRMKERKAKEAVKVDFVTGTAKKPEPAASKAPSAYIKAFGSLAFKN